MSKRATKNVSYFQETGIVLLDLFLPARVDAVNKLEGQCLYLEEVDTGGYRNKMRCFYK